MKPMLLVICPITDHMRARLEARFDLVFLNGLPNGWLGRNGPQVGYVLTDGHLGVQPEILDQLPNVKAISSYGVGYDAIDTEATNAAAIPVAHTPDVLNQEVATTALMLFVACFRNFVAEARHAASGGWESQGGLSLARSADNRKVGVLGLGRIGKAVAAKLAPFNPTLFYTGRNKQDVPYRFVPALLDMAQEVDVLISVAPGGAATHHMINAEVMRALGPNGTLINVGRGSVVDEVALIHALKSGALGWAGLDVFEAEPHIPEALRTHPRAIVTAHIGSATVETRRAMGDLAIDNLISHLETGKLITPVPESRKLCSDDLA